MDENKEANVQITNIAMKENKENQQIKSSRLKEQTNQIGEYEDIDVKDINSKLSRLQDLLKMAKN